MKDYLQLATRGAHAESEMCRLIGAILDGMPRIHRPAIDAIPLLPSDLSDIGALPELVLEIIRSTGVTEASAVATVAMDRGIDVCAIGLGSFLATCMDSPSFQPLAAVESINNFALYCAQLRAVERLEIRAWAGKRLPELKTA